MIPVFGVILSKIMLSSENSNVSVVNLVITLVLVCIGIFMLNYSGKKEA